MMSSKKDRPEDNHSNGSPRGRSRSRSSSRSKSRSKSRSRSRSYSKSRSRSPVYKRKRSYSRSYSRSRSRSRDRYYRSRSRSRDRYYRSRSRSLYSRRSYSPYRRKGRRSSTTSRSPMSRRRRHIGNRFNPECNNVLGVFGLSLYTGEKDVKEIFEKYGKITEVQVVYDHHTRRSRGFAFVYFEDVNDAVEAKENCNGLEVDGRKIRVDYSITKRAHTPTPGIYMGKPTSRSNRDRYDDRERYEDRSERDRGRGDYHSRH